MVSHVASSMSSPSQMLSHPSVPGYSWPSWPSPLSKRFGADLFTRALTVLPERAPRGCVLDATGAAPADSAPEEAASAATHPATTHVPMTALRTQPP